MSGEGGKIKSNRKLTSSKPYDRKLNLLGKLKKSVQDLLIPSWLSDLQQDNETQASGASYGSAQASTSSSEESRTFSAGAHFHQQPEDRPIIDEDQPISYLDEIEEQGNQNSSKIPTYKLCTSGLIGEPRPDVHFPSKTTYTNSITSGRCGELVSQKQDMPSTSRLTFGSNQDSEMIRNEGIMLQESESCHDDRMDKSREMTTVNPVRITTAILHRSSDFSPPVSKRQRLWSPESTRQERISSSLKEQERRLTSSAREKPTFNSLLLGSMNDTSLFGEGFRKSLFYPGVTRYGGASAERRPSLNTSLPYQSALPLRKKVTSHTPSNSTLQATTSATAQRILETLDRMSTPLGDAKKIPLATESANDSLLSFSPSSYRRSTFLEVGRPMTRPLQIPSRGPPTSQHKALAQAVIAANRHRSGVVDRRQVSVMEDEEQGHGDRVSGKSTSQVPEISSLRKDVTLSVSSHTPPSLQPQATRSSLVTAPSIPSVEPMAMNFIFSDPIDEKKQIQSRAPGEVDKSFKFTTPIKPSQAKASAAGAEGESKTCPEPAVGASSGMPLGNISANFNSSTTWDPRVPKPKLSSPDIGGTSSSFKSYNKWDRFGKQDGSSAASVVSTGISLAPAASLKTGSVMDILGGGKSAASVQGTDDLMAKFKKPPGTWECKSCMLSNTPETTKCIACNTAKPSSKSTLSGSDLGTPVQTESSNTVSAASVIGTDNLMAKFKKPAGTWECDSCLLANKPDDSKCIACGVLKPGVKQPSNGTGLSSEKSLNALFKKPPGTWDCDTCMVQNQATALRCVACDSSKPGLQSAGIVTKASATVPSAIVLSPSGGFTFNMPTVNTTTSGSGGFKFGNVSSSSTPSTSVPAATGFVFGQSSVVNKDSNSKSSNGSTTSASLTGGFKFGAKGTEGDSGGTTVGTTSFGITNSGSGFMFGNVSSNTPAAKVNDNANGFQFGEVAKSSTSGSPNTSAGFVPVTTLAFGQSNTGVTNNPSTKDNIQGPSTVGFQFGKISSITGTVPMTSSGLLITGIDMDSKGTSVKLQQPHSNFNFAPTSSTTMPSSCMMTTAQSEKSDLAAVKPASSNLFQFGTSTAVLSSNTGLGMGKSLSDSKPMMNGGFGSGFEAKNDSKPAAQDGNKSFNFSLGTNPLPPFGGFGQVPQSLTTSANAETSQTNKRSVDFGETEHPSAKKSFDFGSSVGQPPSNGPFAFSGSSEGKAPAFATNSTSGSSAGGYIFGSTSNPPLSSSSPAPGGGFQLLSGSSAAPASQGFNFSFKANTDGPNFSFEAPGSKGTMSFNATPNFNFGGAQPASGPSSVFQFGAKPIETSSPGVFAFGSAHPPSVPTDSSGFGAPAGMGAVGSFNIGSVGDNRKMKLARRRLKK